MAVSSSVQVVLLDIEGTICEISFVRDVLFPYALRVLPETVKTQWDEPKFKEYRDLFPAEYRDNQDAFQAHVIDLASRDVKISYLKNLQGYLWEEGYRSGEIKAPLFPDVHETLAKWHGKGVKLMIYSSGSVPAQKLLFKHTNAETPDLTWMISDWFDTINAGPKTESSSYETIAKKHPDALPGQFLFLSDNVKEVEAAIKAGMRSVVVKRPGNAELAPEVYDKYDVVETFQEIEDDFVIKRLQALGKRTADEAVLGEGSDAQVAAAEAPEAENPDAKRLKTTSAGKDDEPSTARAAEKDVAAPSATEPKQDTTESQEEPSRMDKLLAQAVGDAPPTPKTTEEAKETPEATE
ncbi:enolase-phosphatase E1 [Neopestalotiopsis sp. 37M]|nr:enolase-phosphatase E1 [Neopestalotiopsis sp. 37M]